MWLKSRCSKRARQKLQGLCSLMVALTLNSAAQGTHQAHLVSRGHGPACQEKESERICTHFITKVQAVRARSRMGSRWPEGFATPIINQLTLNLPPCAFPWCTGLPSVSSKVGCRLQRTPPPAPLPGGGRGVELRAGPRVPSALPAPGGKSCVFGRGSQEGKQGERKGTQREEEDEEGVTAMVESPWVSHYPLLFRTLMILSVHSPGWP